MSVSIIRALFSPVYSKNNNEYTEFTIAKTVLTADGENVDVCYHSTDNRVAHELYVKDGDTFSKAKAEHDVLCRNEFSRAESLQVDEDGFYVNAITIDGTRSTYRHRFDGPLVITEKNSCYINCGEVAFGDNDRKLLESYKVTKADGTETVKPALYDSLRIPGDVLEKVREAYKNFEKLVKDCGLAVFIDQYNSSIKVGTKDIHINAECDLYDNETFVAVHKTLKELGDVCVYDTESEYLPSIVIKGE